MKIIKFMTKHRARASAPQNKFIKMHYDSYNHYTNRTYYNNYLSTI